MLLLSIMTWGQQPEKKMLRIVDTLTAEEKVKRNPVLLQSEIDSLVSLFNAQKLSVQQPEKIVQEKISPVVTGGIVLITILLLGVIYMLYHHQQRLNRMIKGGDKKPPSASELKNGKAKISALALENKINDLNAELLKLTKENEGLSRVVSEYNGIQHEYDSVKQGMLRAYKIRNYPGYDKQKEESKIMTGVLETENSVAAYAYDKFVKPIFAIADKNKNNPAKISEEDNLKMLDLLVSLSLLYIEYLYLRINELSVGGKMVERIRGFSKGNGIDPLLLRQLNTESGNRALVLRMILNKISLNKLTYPVFEETNLNYQ